MKITIWCFGLLLPLSLLGCMSTKTTTEETSPTISEAAKAIESRYGGSVGIAIIDTEDRSEWGYRADTRFPMMSTFKTLACTQLLAQSDQGLLNMDQEVAIAQEDLVTYSPITEGFVGKTMTLKQACDATMTTSDNTAANIVLAGIGGPEELTSFMRANGDEVTTLVRIEPFLNEAAPGDTRDTSTPLAMIRALQKFLYGDVLSEVSKSQLKQWMVGNKVSDPLSRSVLPTGWSIADRAGAGLNGSRGITAMVWKDSVRKPIFFSIYMTGTTASMEELNQSIAEISQVIFERYNVE